MLPWLLRGVEWIRQACCQHEWIERDNWQGRYLQCLHCLRRSAGWQLRDDEGHGLVAQGRPREGQPS